MTGLWQSTYDTNMQKHAAIVPLTHEEAFIQRYELMLSWAMKLTRQNLTSAEDLLHDAFIQFTLNHPNLNEIENVDGYLRTVLRNVHLSQVRRRAQGRDAIISITEYDSAQAGLRAADQADRVRVQEELRLICDYACVRKETSQAGSVLILRFFHGYFPEEISRITRAPGRAVDKSLWIARSEARLYLDDPRSLRFMRARPAEQTERKTGIRTNADFMLELRETIFISRRGDCLSARELRNLYGTEQDESLKSATTGHLVSCPSCLETVNHLLHLPSLSNRYPTDAIGKDTRPKGGPKQGSGGSGGASSSSARESLHQARRRLREVVEHRPKELHISVNGFILGGQKVSSELNELTLSINIDEKIGFVEVLSEQGIRLMLLNVGPPPDGEAEQQARVELNDGRTLDLALRFGSHWPSLHLVYHNPTLETEIVPQINSPQAVAAPLETSLAPEEEKESVGAGASLGEPFRQTASHVRSWLAGLKFLLRPGAVTAVLSLLLIAALLFLQMRAPLQAYTARDVLRRAGAAEEAIAGRVDLVQHRTINLEEREAGGSTLIARRRVEVWRSAEKGITARRLYDKDDRLIAGEWAGVDGSRTLYQHQAPLHVQREQQEDGLFSIDNIWRFELSAREFTGLVEDLDKAEVKETDRAYVITYQRDGAALRDNLLKVTLKISKMDLRAVEEVFVVRRAAGLREYRFVETSFDREPASGVTPTVFEPDAVLLGSSMHRTELKTEPTREGTATLPEAEAKQPVAAIASPELEVEVTYLLDQIKANLGEQVSVTRTREGLLRVEAIVETEQRKSEILRSLAPVINHPAVRLQIETVAEALARQKQSPPTSGATMTREFEFAAVEPFPAYSELNSYLSKSKGLSNEQADAEARRFAVRMLARSREAMSHAGALKRLVRQFSPEELRQLPPPARAKWLSMIHAHALGFQQQMEEMRDELGPVFSGSASGGDIKEGVEPGSASDLTRAVERLFELGAGADRAISSSFTTSTRSAASPPVKTRQFWQSIRSAEKLADRIYRWQ